MASRVLLRPLKFAQLRSIYTKTSQLPIYLLEHRQKPLVLDFLTQYYGEKDSLMQAMELNREEKGLLLHDIIDDCLRYPVSFAMFDHRNELAACNLNALIDTRHYQKFHGKKEMFYTPKVKKIVRFLDEIEAPLPKSENGEHKWLKVDLICIRPDLEGDRLDLQLWKHAMKKSKDLRCDGLCGQVTSVLSQEVRNLLDEIGFETVKKLECKSTKIVDSNGQPITGQIFVKKWEAPEGNKIAAEA